MPAEPPPRPRAGAFRHPGFARYWLSRFLANFAVQIISMAVGWQVYSLTRDPYDLGIIGLVQFLPAFLLVLVTGAVADRFNRRLVMTLCLVGEALCALGLVLFTATGQHDVILVFALLVLLGVLRAFFGPAQQSLLPNLVPSADLANAIAWSTSSWQIAMVVGPVAGGLLYGLSALTAYGTALVLIAAAAVLATMIPDPAQKNRREPPTLDAMVAGFRYVWSEKIVLGAISFDLFAVLLGGANALLPVYAQDILDVGPWGLGLLRAAPGVGSILVAALLLRHPIRDHAGVFMFACVALFGLFTIVFGASAIVWLSVLALALMGGFDMVSVYVRETLIQLWTPDAVRGRVNAVNNVFVGASNELGEFRAGMSAGLLGAVPAVVLGGVGTILVAALWWRWFPELRRARHLDGRG
ncbi:MFS transporter [Labrys wisconsinensis]|uniref:MFS family permease n=1 Tax=Labrys wisconsinensis TaxID=425677 RepID=A0ABU0JHM3_9HYPH|nr:MFS transporter [Labrys wisconsinensis]MDQ0472918.1 MFS family permease [Labrys wisconsinensis]